MGWISDTRLWAGRLVRLQDLLPATTAGVRLAAVGAFIGYRFAAIAQLFVALTNGSLEHSTRPWLNLATAAFFVVESTAIAVVLWRRKSPEQPRLAICDVATVCLVHLAQVGYAPRDARALTWDAWGFGVASTSVVLICTLPRWRHTLLACGAVLASYIVAIAPPAEVAGQTTTVVANSFGYLMTVVVGRYGWIYLLRISRRADRQAARATAAQKRLTERAEKVSHELHEQTGGLVEYLKTIDSDRGLSTEETAVLHDALWALALRAHRELHDELPASTPRTLGQQLHVSVREASNGLRVDCTTYAVDDLRLASPVLVAVGHAVEALLSNVRRHSGARQATVFAAVTKDLFEVSVTDNGTGFDPAHTPRGYGLAAIADAHLDRHGIVATVDSQPGVGTTVTLAGPTDMKGGRS